MYEQKHIINKLSNNQLNEVTKKNNFTKLML